MLLVARGEDEKKGTSNASVVSRADLMPVRGFGSSERYMSSSVFGWKFSSPELKGIAFFLLLGPFFSGGSLDLEEGPFLSDVPESGETRRGTPALSSFLFLPRNFHRP